MHVQHNKLPRPSVKKNRYFSNQISYLLATSNDFVNATLKDDDKFLSSFDILQTTEKDMKETRKDHELDAVFNESKQSFINVFVPFLLYFTLNFVFQLLFSFKIMKQEQNPIFTKSTTLQDCLNNEQIKNSFKKFIHLKRSTENYLIYVDILTFQKLSTPQEIHSFAQQIYQNYLNHNYSPFQVNIDHQLVLDAQVAIHNQKVDAETFNEIQLCILENLNVLFQQFKIKKLCI